jgi:transposase-like protein
MMRPVIGMDEQRAACTCPHSGSATYTVRYSEMIDAKDGQSADKKFRCKTCGREWKARGPE